MQEEHEHMEFQTNPYEATAISVSNQNGEQCVQALEWLSQNPELFRRLPVRASFTIKFILQDKSYKFCDQLKYIIL